MIEFKRGDILRISDYGLNWLCGGNIEKRKRLRAKRFEARCRTRRFPECISVIEVGKRYYHSYHESFLRQAKYE